MQLDGSHVPIVNPSVERRREDYTRLWASTSAGVHRFSSGRCAPGWYRVRKHRSGTHGDRWPTAVVWTRGKEWRSCRCLEVTSAFPNSSELFPIPNILQPTRNLQTPILCFHISHGTPWPLNSPAAFRSVVLHPPYSTLRSDISYTNTPNTPATRLLKRLCID